MLKEFLVLYFKYYYLFLVEELKENNIEYIINGKTLVITDLHIGLKKANQSRLTIIVNVFKNFLKTIKEENISNVICCGDIFHSRIALDLQALNVGLKLLNALAEKCNCYLILGNHDIYYKNSINVNSTNVFRQNKRIHVIENPTIALINGQKALFVPWLSNLSNFHQNEFDLMFGHFEINVDYLIASFIEDNSKDISSDISLRELIENDSLLEEVSGDTSNIEKKFNKIKSEKTNSKVIVGKFIELVKEGGTIFAGHIHNRKEFVTKMRHFVFVGSPYQQNFGEMNSESGYYVLDEHNRKKFIATKNVPKHIRINVSDVLKSGIDNYDYTMLSGNIIQKNYDVDIDLETESRINQKIADSFPFEEALPNYSIALSADRNVITNESIETIKKSKLEYIRQYIQNIDQKTLDSSNLNKDELYKILEKYFKAVTEGI